MSDPQWPVVDQASSTVKDARLIRQAQCRIIASPALSLDSCRSVDRPDPVESP